MARNVVQVSTEVALGLKVERVGQKTVFLKSGESLTLGRSELHYIEERDKSQPIGFQRVSKIMWFGGRAKQLVYALKLEPDQKYYAGPKYAHKVPDPEMEKDPILRALRRYEVPIGCLHYHSGPVPDGNRYTHNWPNDHRQYALFSEVEGFKTITEQNRFVVCVYHRYYEGYSYEPDFISGDGGDYYWNVTNFSMIEAVYVHPLVDPEMLEQALRRAIAWGKEKEILYPANGCVWENSEPDEATGPSQKEIEKEIHDNFMDSSAAAMAEVDDLEREIEQTQCPCNEMGPKCTTCLGAIS